MKNKSFWNDNFPLFVLIFIICFPTMVGVVYQVLH